MNLARNWTDNRFIRRLKSNSVDLMDRMRTGTMVVHGNVTSSSSKPTGNGVWTATKANASHRNRKIGDAGIAARWSDDRRHGRKIFSSSSAQKGG